MTGIIALAQIAPRLANLEKNIETHVEYIERAIEQDAKLVIFPELSLSGYTVRDSNFELALRKDDPKLAPLKQLSKRITIVCGGVEESEQFGVYNSAFVFDEGKVATYRKIYPPDYGIFEERRYFLSGTSAQPITTRHGLLGVLVCEDLWHLSLPLLMAYQGATLLCVISASPTRLPGMNSLTNHALNSQHHAAYARLLSVNLAFVNRVGYEDGVNFWGGSQFVNAHGDIAATADGFNEELLLVKADETDVRDARRNSRHFLDDDPWFLQRELNRLLQ